jgi:hypothetical protein
MGTEPDLLADTGEIRLRPYFRLIAEQALHLCEEEDERGA